MSTAIYCRNCGYDLRGQVTAPDQRCPECGRAFDASNKRTFRSRPPSGPWARWSKRIALSVLAVLLALGATWLWFYWGWKTEQSALDKLDIRHLGLSSFEKDDIEPLVGIKFQACLGSAGWVLNRIRKVHLIRTQYPELPHPRDPCDLSYLGDLKWARDFWLVDSEATDPELAGLCHLTHLESIHLERNPRISGEGLNLQNLKELQALDIQDTPFSDAAMSHLSDLKKLEDIFLYHTTVSDAGLVYLKDLRALRRLSLDAKITDAGLIHLKDLQGLRELDLSYTDVTDAGLAYLGHLKNLQNLNLYHTKVTDAGMANLEGLEGLQFLVLENTEVTDAGLVHLDHLKNLRTVSLNGTRVTESGLKSLQAALPKARILPRPKATPPAPSSQPSPPSLFLPSPVQFPH